MEEASIRARLWALKDEEYARLQRRLMPTVAPERVIGVRTPALRALARELAGSPEAEAFLRDLPHGYYEEDNLHAYLLERIRGFEDCAAAVDAFLPCVDNWATCDTMNPRALGREPDALLVWIRRWLDSGRLYTMRFGVGMLMRHFLGERFQPEYLEWAAALPSEEYYLQMMVAWYFATALAFQYDAALPWLEERRLAEWTHNKAIQKAVESRRITEERKEYLSGLRIR